MDEVKAIRMSDDDKLEKLIVKNHTLMDLITELAEDTKMYYSETDDKNFKEVFKILNDAYCSAGMKIGMLNVDLTTAQIEACLKALKSWKV